MGSGYFQCYQKENDGPGANYSLRFAVDADSCMEYHYESTLFAIVITWFKKMLPKDHALLHFYCNESIVEVLGDLKLLGCNASMNESTYLSIPYKVMSQSNPLSNASKHEQELNKVKKLLLVKRENLDWFERVQTAVKNSLFDSAYITRQEYVANSLNLSVRNMQRKLKKMGISYQSILDEHRRVLAISFLQESEVSLSDISHLVGFTEPSAFYKAFRRWTGKRPGDYRQDAIK